MSTLSEDADGIQQLTFNHGGSLVHTEARVIAAPYQDGTAFVNILTQTRRTADDSLHHSQDTSVFLPSAAVARKLGEMFMRLSEQLGYAEDKPKGSGLPPLTGMEPNE